jgi:hypothetical protein
MSKYELKYNKYKKICCDILNKSLCLDFYFVHDAGSEKNIYKILKDKYLKSSSITKNTRFSSYTLSHIFSNIYFNDIKNIKDMNCMLFIISPFVMFDMDVYFNKGWSGLPNYNNDLNLLKSDSLDVKLKKLDKIKKFVHNPKELNSMIRSTPIMTHECLFPKNISLEDHLLGIVCYKCDVKKIRKLLKGTAIENVKIFSNGEGLPSLKDLF